MKMASKENDEVECCSDDGDREKDLSEMNVAKVLAGAMKLAIDSYTRSDEFKEVLTDAAAKGADIAYRKCFEEIQALEAENAKLEEEKLRLNNEIKRLKEELKLAAEGKKGEISDLIKRHMRKIKEMEANMQNLEKELSDKTKEIKDLKKKVDEEKSLKQQAICAKNVVIHDIKKGNLNKYLNK